MNSNTRAEPSPNNGSSSSKKHKTPITNDNISTVTVTPDHSVLSFDHMN